MKEIIATLRKRYSEPVIPPCSVCGKEMSIQRCGGGSPTIWACDGLDAEGRRLADDHYERSRWTDYRAGGDADVITLLEAYEALLKVELPQTYQIDVRGDGPIRLWSKVDVFKAEDVIAMLKKANIEVET